MTVGCWKDPKWVTHPLSSTLTPYHSGKRFGAQPVCAVNPVDSAGRAVDRLQGRTVPGSTPYLVVQGKDGRAFDSCPREGIQQILNGPDCSLENDIFGSFNQAVGQRDHSQYRGSPGAIGRDGQSVEHNVKRSKRKFTRGTSDRKVLVPSYPNRATKQQMYVGRVAHRSLCGRYHDGGGATAPPPDWMD